MKQKRGLSGIVTALIIIALSLVAVGVVWTVTNNVLESSEQEVNTGTAKLFQKCSDFNYTKVEVGQGCYGTEKYVGGEKCCLGIIPDYIPGLIAYWALDGNANDSAGDNDGTVYGNVSFVEGKSGKAADFDGDGDYIDVPDYIPNYDNFTASAWFVIDSEILTWTIYPILGNVQGTPFLGYRLGSNNFYQLRQYIGGSESIYWGTIDLTDSQWHHVLLVVNQEDYTAELFLDGDSYGIKNIGTEGYTHVNGALKAIGKDYNVYWNGTIDEVRVYNKTLNESEIMALYLYP